ncbi:unnamed protein product, partial [Medioppia subpectinata]
MNYKVNENLGQTDCTTDNITHTKCGHVLSEYNSLTNNEPDQFVTPHNQISLNQLETENNVNTSSEARELTAQYETITTSLKTQYNQKMNELFADHGKFYEHDHLDTLNNTILYSLVNDLTETDVGSDAVPIEPYKQALYTYVRDKYRGYSEINRLLWITTILNNLDKQYEHELNAWIESVATDADDEPRYVDESRLIRTRIVSENSLIYGERLDLQALNARFDATHDRLRRALADSEYGRYRAIDTIVERAIQLYKREMDRDSEYWPGIRPDRLDEINDELMMEAVTRFSIDHSHMSLDTYTGLVRNKLQLAYDTVMSAPTGPAVDLHVKSVNIYMVERSIELTTKKYREIFDRILKLKYYTPSDLKCIHSILKFECIATLNYTERTFGLNCNIGADIVDNWLCRLPHVESAEGDGIGIDETPVAIDEEAVREFRQLVADIGRRLTDCQTIATKKRILYAKLKNCDEIVATDGQRVEEQRIELFKMIDTF